MIGWFIVPITGDGKSVDTAFAATLTSEVSAHVAVIGVSPATGTPTFTWALIQAGGNAFTNLLATSGVFQLPAPSSALVSTLTASQMLAITQALSHYSIPVSPNATETLTSLITRLAKLQEPAFDVGSFWINVPANAVP